jgi:hypothetical protein
VGAQRHHSIGERGRPQWPVHRLSLAGGRSRRQPCRSASVYHGRSGTFGRPDSSCPTCGVMCAAGHEGECWGDAAW